MCNEAERAGYQLTGLSRMHYLERVMGIEPTLFAWEARVLPLNDTRVVGSLYQSVVR